MKRAICILLSCIFSLSVAVFSVQAAAVKEYNLPFVDLDSDRHIIEAINYCYEKKFMCGTSKNTFSPDSDLTRAQFIVILYAFAGRPKIKSNIINPFCDVNTSWYYNAVLWAKSEGIVYGVSANEFKPNSMITNQMFYTVLYAYAKNKLGYNKEVDMSVLNEYPNPDEISPWAKEAYAWGIETRIFAHYNIARPNYWINRYHVACSMRNFNEMKLQMEADKLDINLTVNAYIRDEWCLQREHIISPCYVYLKFDGDEEVLKKLEAEKLYVCLFYDRTEVMNIHPVKIADNLYVIENDCMSPYYKKNNFMFYDLNIPLDVFCAFYIDEIPVYKQERVKISQLTY